MLILLQVMEQYEFCVFDDRSSIGPLIPDVTLHLFSVGVLNFIDLGDPELSGLTHADFATNPGILIRIVGVADLSRWPET